MKASKYFVIGIKNILIIKFSCMKLFAPSIKVCHESNLKKFENFIKIKYKKEFKFYSDFWQWTINYPDKFWSSLADYFNLEFKKKKFKNFKA